MRKLLLILISFLILMQVKAQEWEPTYGPNQNRIYSLIKYNGFLYAGTEWGAFFSSDEGRSWKNLSIAGYIHDIKICKNKLYAASYFHGLFVSSDGILWNKVQGIKSGIRQIEVIDDNIYALAPYKPFEIFYSTDGIEWKDISKENAFYDVTGICSLNNSLFVYGVKGDRSGPELISTSDKGITWKNHHALGSAKKILAFQNNLYLLTIKDIFISADMGNSWSSITGDFPKSALMVNMCIDEEYIFATTHLEGIFRTKRDNIKWEFIGLKEHYLQSLFSIDNNIYVCSSLGEFFRSLNWDVNWEKQSKYGIYAGTGIGKMKSTGNKLWVQGGYNSPVYYSDDFGKNWFNKDWNYSNVEIIELGDTIITTTQDNKGIFYSTDGGVNFQKSDFLSQVYIKGIERFKNKVFLIAGGLFFSGNGGENWKEIDFPEKVWLEGMLATENWLFAFTSHKIYRSNDGINWWLSDFPEGFHYFEGLVKAGGKIITNSGNDFYISDDACFSWQKIETEGLPEANFSKLVSTGNKIYLNAFEFGERGMEIYKGIFLSEDYGQTWMPFNDGLENLEIRALTAHDTIIFAGVSYNGVYKLNNLDVRDSIQIDGPLKVNHYGKSLLDLTLHPNPTSSHFTLSFEPENADVTVTDFSGKVMLKQQVLSGENISTSGFSKGIYFVQVKVGEEVVRRKLVVQ